ncbi:AAA-domain-containing protein [Venturia nashicola]|uniref:AAA-domain-containing protein n=1 Tax=Venturia nashicola TaxID=86259 RepID=A0A4Z1PF87_9PEZI|nr:AAA-domain-containing protein [Venturia nashicola]TLD32271.1 AAA-domain-containing protein [Venturia nashicola]
MPPQSGPKRKLEDFDPNASDPNDSDFEEQAVRSSTHRRKPTSQKKANRGISRGHRRDKKRRRANSDDSDIVDDDEDISEDIFTESEEEEEEPERNPRTGRAVRSAVKKEVKYEESDIDEIEETADEEDELVLSPQKNRASRRAQQPTEATTLIVKLDFTKWSSLKDFSVPQTRRSTRSRTANPPPVTMRATRKSSRLSQEPEPYMELTSSGKHANIRHPGTSSPEQVEIGGRRTRGGKGPRGADTGKQPRKGMVSDIMEASQDTERASEEEPEATGSDGVADAEVENEGMPEEVLESVERLPEEDEEEEGTAAEEAPVEEVVEEARQREPSDESDGPVRRSARNLRSQIKEVPESSQQKRKRGIDESSDYAPDEEAVVEEENMSESDEIIERKRQKTSSSDSQGRRTRNSQRQRRRSSASADLDEDELAEEVHELKRAGRETRQTRHSQNRGHARAPQGITYDDTRTRRQTKQVDYTIHQLNDIYAQDDDAAQNLAETAPKKKKGGAWRPLFSTAGPFGGFGGPKAAFGGPDGEGAVGGVDSDSSDDEGARRPQQGGGIGGAVGMTPTTAKAPGFPTPAVHEQGGQQSGGGPANFGKVTKEKKALADADPLGVDENVNFDAVGGLEDHITKLKEMVVIPLLYPEIFTRFSVTPPRGVLFHGPPGTGKTLLARALANSVSVSGKKVTFFIRKGADALSKWVGEAERQLRLLFEEAQKCQPSIIFFDEIDGLAPVRSSKQEQIHASIVATLLALMDGMDGRGQVIVIGATNRPDNVDPALRRPGRFDREFYFPLPDMKARRAIIDINTKGWEPPLAAPFKDQLADLTKGYGGADLRALCTEAALNAVQGTFPQIYSSDKKLQIDTNKIKVLAKDFMLSVNKIVPSSERSSTGKVEPLSGSIEPLLRKPLNQIHQILEEVFPRRAKLTALEEAQFDDRDDNQGFERETMQREFDRARVFRPRLLIRGIRGMGQHHISSALLHKFEGVFVQSFDMATLMEESSRSPEAAVIQLFKEVRRHTPSVVFLPNVDVWYETVGPTVVKTFSSLLRGIPPNDPILVLGIMETDTPDEKPNPNMMRDLFGFSARTDYEIKRPDHTARSEFFDALVGYVRKRPAEFPDPEHRKRRRIEILPEAPQIAPEPATKPTLTKQEVKAQKKNDRHTLNQLKIHINGIMEQIKQKYKKFRQPPIDERQIGYLYNEQNPDVLTTDLSAEQQQAQQVYRPFELDTDKHGVGGLREVATGKFYYNIDIVIIELRLSNGYYKRFKDFFDDVKRMAKDAKTMGDRNRTISANELLANVEVDMMHFAQTQPALNSECEAVYLRELAREKEAKKSGAGPNGGAILPVPQSIPTTEDSGPVLLGEPVPGRAFLPPVTPRRPVLSNGDTEPLTNGSHEHDEDIFMADADGLGSVQRHRATEFPSAAAHTGINSSQMHRQGSALQRMAPGSQVQDYHNSASTTTSGNKSSNRTSDHSVQTGSASQGLTQGSNGTESRHFPLFSRHEDLSTYDELPDTQEPSDQASGQSTGPKENLGEQLSLLSSASNTQDSAWSEDLLLTDTFTEIASSQHTSSQSQLASSQHQFSIPTAPASAARAATADAGTSQGIPNVVHPSGVHQSNITSILNSPIAVPAEVTEVIGAEAMEVAHAPYNLSDIKLAAFKDELVSRTTGMSVEQLEQIHAACVDAIWKSRGNWDRDEVVGIVLGTFRQVVMDIESWQGIGEGSF